MSAHRFPSLEGLRRAFAYPRSAEGAISDLGEKLRLGITENGPLPFSDFMAQCLYHPQLGYYARPEATTVSKDGDFMTSVSVGPVFGQLLARRIERFWQLNGAPEDFCIFEVGAHNGSLAKDILPGLSAELRKVTRYHIIEPLENQRVHLAKTLGPEFTILSAPLKKATTMGVVVANEVFDALPVPLYLFSNEQWHEATVTWDDGFDWATRATDFSLPGNYPEGYVTEGRPNLVEFISPLTECFEKGLMTFIDYGLDEPSLYHPSRTAGTLRCYRKHSMTAHPLDHPGEQDLTSDVNFSAVEETATQLGLSSAPVMSQSRYLTHCAKEWLLSGTPPNASELRQFQTLIHPSQFGNRFYALELLKGPVERGFFE
ncbi:SAM-dependent methyltransferase [Akkermansiaceae bacterium]|nr:SAM-dependent methyltransferase [Akkermansiaceae bacterium]